MRFVFIFILLLCATSSFAQQEEPKLQLSPDLHLRTFWMSTSYREDFKNDYALGTSLNLGGKASMKEFEFRIGYRMFGNLWSSDLAAPDPLSGQSNRYELGLFDLLNPSDRFFGKLETLSLSYSRDRWGIEVGRMGIDTDWVNLQDGRLAPTAIEGFHAWIAQKNDWELGVWAISRMSIRGSSEWLGVGETVGIFPVARDPSGKPSGYFENTKSNWIAIVELSKKWKSYTVDFSNTVVENISNTAWLRGEKKWKYLDKTWLLGLQAGYQIGIGDGGNSDLRLAYKNPDDQNWAVSARIGWDKSRWTGHVSYTKVGGSGRWLSPREWGKDAWYTFIPRERNEGYESMDALTGYLNYDFSDSGFAAYIHAGLHWLPDLNDAEANKYNFPSYRQINLGLRYAPRSDKRFDIHAILMNKEALGKTGLTANQQYNKVGLWHVNLIANIYLN